MKSKTRWVGKLLLCGSLAVAVVLLGSAARANGDDAAALYKSKCAMCHGPDGKGETATGKAIKVRSLISQEVKKESDAELTSIIVQGKGNMPGYDKNLTDEQIKDLVKYIRSLNQKTNKSGKQK